MKHFRTFLFWAHLASGIVAGLVIGLMCLTGTALAFEKDLIAWAERDARQVPAPAPGALRLSLDQMLARVREARPDASPASFVVAQDPLAAVAITLGRAEVLYVDPYTGEVRTPRSRSMANFMRTMLVWHRYLGFSGEESRPRGKLVTGVCTISFCFLAVSGLYLWLPRSWSWRAVRPSIWFRQNLSGRARDFSWHNVIGFWSAPILIVLTLTALPISFRWAGQFLYTLTETPMPASGPQGSGAPPPTAQVPAPPAGTKPVSPDVLLATVVRELPAWKTITHRFPAAGQPATFAVREHGSWPRTAVTTLQFDPFSGSLLRQDGHADLSPARKLRAWSRFLHTGEALGRPGQLVAGMASLGGFLLVCTGFALAFRRFFGRKPDGVEAREGA